MAILKAISERRSIRRFLPNCKIAQETIMAILEAARQAPSGSNSQPWRFVVVQDKMKIEELIKASYGQEYFKNCSCVIVCCAYIKAKEHAEKRLKELADIGAFSQEEIRNFLNLGLRSKPEQDEAKAIRDTAISIYSMMLQATDLNLGSCWIAIRDKEMVKKTVRIQDETIILVAMLALGKAAETPSVRPRFPLDDIAFFEEWMLPTNNNKRSLL